MFNLGEFSMKKTLVAIAALAATASFAQSSVTISGIMDLGVVYNNNIAPGAPKLSLGAANNNRIIFSGVEDLGGGMAATFGAQIRFSPTAGTNEGGSAGAVTSANQTAGQGILKDANGVAILDAKGNNISAVNYGRPLFQGETRVGLRGGFGHIRLGRGLTALQAPNGGYIDPWGVSTVAGSIYAPGYATDYVAGGEGRTDGIFYDSPNFSGFQASLTFSPRKVATSTASPAATYGKSFTSIALTYNNGPIQLLIGQENNRYGDKLLNIGGNYNLGVAKIYAGYGAVTGGAAVDRAAVPFFAGSSNYPGGSAPVKATAKITALSFGAAIPVGAATIRAGYSRVNPNAIQFATDQTDSKLGLGVEYALSKRTSLYTDFASQTRKNNAVGTNPATNTSRISTMDFGMTHKF
jgi:predicted porin